MMLLSQAAQAIGGKVISNDVRLADVNFTAVSTDTRSIAAGDLFVALRGPNFDGAAFTEAAAQSGAVAALINADSSPSMRATTSTIPFIVVDDTRLALGRLAAYWRTQFTIPIVAVTGSNGKTTVKEMLASILKATGGNDSVLATAGNFNNDIGLPLTLLKLRSNHRYAVIEMGMNHAGEIEYLTRLTRPDMALINNAGSAHLAGLGTVEAVARAKGEIFLGLSPEGIAIINADDLYAPLWRQLIGTRTVLDFGLDQNVAIHAQWQPTDDGAHMVVTTPQGKFSAQLRVPGAHNVRNALAATAAAVALQVPLHAIARGLENFAGVVGRMQRKPALHGAHLIDDSYNANPASLRAALKVLMQSAGKKILVLGDMGELGDDAVRMHSEAGAEAHHMGVAKLLAMGELTRHTVQHFGANATHFERLEDLLEELEKNLDANTTLLVKGSRFMHMERVVKHCVADKAAMPEDRAEASPANHAQPPAPYQFLE